MSQSDQYRRRERYNRSYGTRRTDFDLSMGNYEEDCEPVTYRALERIHIIVPAQYTFTIHPNKRHVSLHRPEKRPVRETVRRNETVSYYEDRNEAYDRSSQRHKELQEREAQLLERQRRLETELEAVEQKEIEERIGVRERRPYARGALSDQASTAIPKDASRPTLTRRVTFVEREPESPTHSRYQCYGDRDSHPSSRDRFRADPTCQDAASHSQSRRYHIEEIYSPSDCRTADRRPPRQVVRKYRYYKGVPFLFQRFVIGGRRESAKSKSVRENPEHSKHIRSIDIQYESRAPDDYV